LGWLASLLRDERQAPRFFAAYAQSALGTGAGYVAVVLVAYARFHSPLAISLVLLADIAPPIVLGPLLGAAVDRWSRRWCAVAADASRALAFAGIALTHNFVATVLLALVAGAGTTLWKPAIMSGLPSIVSRERLPSATALYGALTEIGYTAGPALAALVLLFSGPSVLLAANAASFAISASLLSTLSFGAIHAPEEREGAPRRSLLREAREGIGVAARTPTVRVVIVAASCILFFGGIINVSELLLSNQLGAGRGGYALLVTVSGIGIGLGSLVGKSGGALPLLQRRFFLGLGLFAVGLVGAAAASAFAAVAVGITVGAVGNGMVIVFQRLILQASVEDELLGRIFGAQVALDGVAFTSSYLIAGALLEVASPRTMFVVAGAGAALVACATAYLSRHTWLRRDAEAPAADAGQTGETLVAVGGPEPR
jgi:MFS family permease